MTYDHDWGQECAPYERDFHQEAKDNAAQGIDREPYPPEEHFGAVDLEKIERLLKALPPTMTLTSEKAELLAALPDLVTELRQKRAEVARWELMPAEYRYVAVGPERDSNGRPMAREIPRGEVAAWTPDGPDSRLMRRTVHLGPQEDVTDYDTEPPF
ncbi:hypothetical protein [Streptosporangium sp. NPDC051022]|uniref:hypothetical protein n=1 Tax=Streptosporangium sp. NPDC051022 TaxID=3155752 RepID=UPI003413B746